MSRDSVKEDYDIESRLFLDPELLDVYWLENRIKTKVHTSLYYNIVCHKDKNRYDGFIKLLFTRRFSKVKSKKYFKIPRS